MKKTELSYAGLSGRVSPYCVPETSSSNEELDILYPLDLFCSVGAQVFSGADKSKNDCIAARMCRIPNTIKDRRSSFSFCNLNVKLLKLCKFSFFHLRGSNSCGRRTFTSQKKD